MAKNLFNEIVRRSDIHHIRPIVMSARRGSSSPADGGLSLESSFSFDLNDDRDDLSVIYDYRLSQEPDDALLDREALFEAKVTYEIRYSFSPPLTEDHETELPAFVEHNARFNSWGYLRAFLAHTAADFELPSVTLPLLKPNVVNPTRTGE